MKILYRIENRITYKHNLICKNIKTNFLIIVCKLKSEIKI